MRESWWLVVVAAFIWLALILATYTKTDQGWSYSGTGAPIGNKGGVAGAWLADLLLYLFGFSAWWWVVARHRAGRRRLPPHRPSRARDRSSAGARRPRLRARAAASAALELLRFYRLAGRRCRRRPGGALGDLSARALSRLLGYNGATLLLIALFAAGCSLFFGMSWLKLMERVGGGVESLSRLAAAPLRRARRSRARRAGAGRARSGRRAGEARRARASRFSSSRAARSARNPARAIKERQRPLFQDLPDSPLPPLDLLEEAPSAQDTVSADALEYTSRLIERKLADFGVAVKVLAAYPGPVITRYEIEPAVGVKGARSST